MFLRPPYSYSNFLVFACFFGGFWVDLLISNIITEIYIEDEGGILPPPPPPPPEWILILSDDFNWSYY